MIKQNRRTVYLPHALPHGVELTAQRSAKMVSRSLNPLTMIYPPDGQTTPHTLRTERRSVTKVPEGVRPGERRV